MTIDVDQEVKRSLTVTERDKTGITNHVPIEKTILKGVKKEETALQTKGGSHQMKEESQQRKEESHQMKEESRQRKGEKKEGVTEAETETEDKVCIFIYF